MDLFAEPRRRLVVLLRQQGIRDEAVLAAIGRVRREAFVPPAVADQAYENVALPIGLGQTISQPYVVALMSEVLRVDATSRVLEVGTGSGYQAAILAELGYQNVELHRADGSLGWSQGAPYDRIIVTAAGPQVPAVLLDQLGVGGRLVMPVGSRTEQELVLVQRTASGVEQRGFGGVRFVPLLGEGAWPDTSA